MNKFTVPAIVFFLAVSQGICTEYAYTQKVKEKTINLTVNITETDDLKYVKTKDDYYNVINEVKVKKGYGVIEWVYKDEKNNTDLKGVREGDIIRLSGVLKGKEYRKDNYIDKRPWYQIFTWEMDYFIMGKDREMEFWAVRPDNPDSVGVLVAVREKEETVTVSGSNVEALRVRVALAGLLSIFWSGNYWFRKSDGFYVKSNPTSDITVELNN